MREPGTPYAHTNSKPHKLKHTTPKIEVKGCNGARALVNKEGKDNKRSLSNSKQSNEIDT